MWSATVLIGFFLPYAISGVAALKLPVVQLDQGVVTGINVPQFGVDNFLGIRYAAPPIGNLRFAVPHPVGKNKTAVINATAYGKACLQPLNYTEMVGLYLPLTRNDVSEDCLTINIIRPQNISAHSKLPVMMYVYGGSFNIGFGSRYNGTQLVAQSMTMNEPIIFASINYRLNAAGFLASNEIANAAKIGEATLNAGQHDVRFALKWLQENIGQFGGDKSKVTVFGQSAGAILIGGQLVANGGNNEGLFRGAIMQSGSPSGVSIGDPSAFQPAYEKFAALLGCSVTPNATSLPCLRAASTDMLLNASSVFVASGGGPFGLVLDGYFYNGPPSSSVRAGKVPNIPIITGDDLDEGTIFTPKTVTQDSQTKAFANAYLGGGNSSIAEGLLNTLLDLYPNIPALGSPYAPVNISVNDTIYGPGNQFKRCASIIGDLLFESGRRLLLDEYVKKDQHYPAYSYSFRQTTSLSDSPYALPSLGVYHSSEVQFVYGQYLLPNASSEVIEVTKYIETAWIAFANNLHPNRRGLPPWPKYGKSKNLLQIKAGNFTVIKDDYRKKGIDFFNSLQFSATFSR